MFDSFMMLFKHFLLHVLSKMHFVQGLRLPEKGPFFSFGALREGGGLFGTLTFFPRGGWGIIGGGNYSGRGELFRGGGG